MLWVKGSGGDLRTAKRDGFASLYLDKVRAMKPLYLSDPGARAEDAGRRRDVPDVQPLRLQPQSARLLDRHAAAHLRALQARRSPASERGDRHRGFGQSGTAVQEIYGDDVIYVPWQRPGFDIGLMIEQLIKDNPQAKGVLLGHHGMSSWSNDDKTCYETALEIIDRARRYIEAHDKGERTFGGQRYAALPQRDAATRARRDPAVAARPGFGRAGASSATVQDDPKMLRFVNSVDGPRLAELGTSCPDHFLRTKIKPLFVDWDPAAGDVEVAETALAEGLAQYRKDYAAYYDRCKRPDSPAMRDPNPTVILIPGLGMIAWGKNKSESRVTAEFYNCAIEVMRGAEAIDRYEAMDEQEAFDIEYWPLEEAKLRRLPPEKELDRQIIVVVGAGAGIGKATAHRLVKEGAHIVCVDLDEAAAKATAQRDHRAHTARASAWPARASATAARRSASACDITNREASREMFEDAMLAYGGIDSVVVTAGIFVPPDKTGRIDDTPVGDDLRHQRHGRLHRGR